MYGFGADYRPLKTPRSLPDEAYRAAQVTAAAQAAWVRCGAVRQRAVEVACALPPAGAPEPTALGLLLTAKAIRGLRQVLSRVGKGLREDVDPRPWATGSEPWRDPESSPGDTLADDVAWLQSSCRDAALVLRDWRNGLDRAYAAQHGPWERWRFERQWGVVATTSGDAAGRVAQTADALGRVGRQLESLDGWAASAASSGPAVAGAGRVSALTMLPPGVLAAAALAGVREDDLRCRVPSVAHGVPVAGLATECAGLEAELLRLATALADWRAAYARVAPPSSTTAAYYLGRLTEGRGRTGEARALYAVACHLSAIDPHPLALAAMERLGAAAARR